MGDKIYTGINIFQYIATIFQADLLFKWIQIGLAIIMTLVGIAYKVWKWYKEANEDGVITKEELHQLHEETKDDVSNLVDNTVDLIEDINEHKNKDVHGD